MSLMKLEENIFLISINWSKLQANHLMSYFNKTATATFVGSVKRDAKLAEHISCVFVYASVQQIVEQICEFIRDLCVILATVQTV